MHHHSTPLFLSLVLCSIKNSKTIIYHSPEYTRWFTPPVLRCRYLLNTLAACVCVCVCRKGGYFILGFLEWPSLHPLWLMCTWKTTFCNHCYRLPTRTENFGSYENTVEALIKAPLNNNYDLQRRLWIRAQLAPSQWIREVCMATLTTDELEYVIPGYRKYKCVWSPEVNERLRNSSSLKSHTSRAQNLSK